MDAEAIGEAILAMAYIILGLGMLGLSCLLIYWQVKFVVTVPKHLKRIAEALEKIAKK